MVVPQAIVITALISGGIVPPAQPTSVTPCAYLFDQAGGSCLDGVFTLEVTIGERRKIISVEVTSSSTSAHSSGPVDRVAQCVADNMDYYGKSYIHKPDQLGKQTVTVHVVTARSCKRP